MSEVILLGDEAVARGAIDAGIHAAYAYPGTPSTEIFQTIQDHAKEHGLPVNGLWSTNEKVAIEEAVGVSYAGCRAVVSMKHVGLNVAAPSTDRPSASPNDSAPTPPTAVNTRARAIGAGLEVGFSR